VPAPKGTRTNKLSYGTLGCEQKGHERALSPARKQRKSGILFFWEKKNTWERAPARKGKKQKNIGKLCRTYGHFYLEQGKKQKGAVLLGGGGGGGGILFSQKRGTDRERVTCWGKKKSD